MTWKSAGLEEKTEIIALIGRSTPAFRRDPERCLIDTLDLPFYPGGRLARIRARDVPGGLLWYTCLPETAVAMNAQMASVNACNAAGPLMIKDGNVHDYVRFMYYFTSGARLFESRAKRSSVGYTGKIWLFEGQRFFEIDINISPRGIVTELEKVEVPDVPPFEPGDFDIQEPPPAA